MNKNLAKYDFKKLNDTINEISERLESDMLTLIELKRELQKFEELKTINNIEVLTNVFKDCLNGKCKNDCPLKEPNVYYHDNPGESTVINIIIGAKIKDQPLLENIMEKKLQDVIITSNNKLSVFIWEREYPDITKGLQIKL